MVPLSLSFVGMSPTAIVDLLWGMVCGGILLAYGMTLFGCRRRNGIMSLPTENGGGFPKSLVGIWLVTSVTKQRVVGRDHVGGSMEDYWSLYVSLRVVHTGLTIVTISLGGTDMVIGLRRPRHGIGAGSHGGRSLVTSSTWEHFFQ